MAGRGIGAIDEIARLSLGDEAVSRPPTPPAGPLDADNAGIVAVDIADKFSAAVATLGPGELVKDGFFTLFESVGGLEIMDPKMDSGCVSSGDDFDEVYDVARPLLPDEVLGILDQLLCHEMSWHLGHPLSQTLFTSVYVEALLMPPPSRIQEATLARRAHGPAELPPMLQVLRAYCLAMLKACGYVNERIKSEHYYEEEDFVTNTYNRNLLTNIPTAEILKVLVEAQGVVQAQRPRIGADLADALLSRLRLRRIFLAAAECPNHVKEAAKALEPWEDGLSLLPQITATHPLGRPVDEAFSAKLQRKLASTMPPRPIIELGFDDAMGHLTRLFQDGAEVIGVLDLNGSQCLQTFVFTFQAKKPQPLVYARTLLQTFLFSAMELLDSMAIHQLLDDDLSVVSLPASPILDRDNGGIEAVSDPRFAMAWQIEAFRQRAAQPFLDILRTACQNRCRVRRTLCHLIRDWETLQLDAEGMDHDLQAAIQELIVKQPPTGQGPVELYALPLSSWCYLYKLRQMELIVQLGFELRLHHDDELAGMYWYLNYLAQFRLQHSERIKTFVVHRLQEARSQPSRPAPAVEEQLRRSLAFTRLSLLDAAVTWELSDALCHLYMALQRLGLMLSPPRPYSTDELRFALRTKPFTAIGFPAPPTFAEFTAGTTQPDATTEELLRYGERAVVGAKKGLETLSKMSPDESFSVGSHERWVATVKRALRSSIATKIAICSLQKALLKQSSGAEGLGIRVEVPTPGTTYHDWWIVPKIIAAH